MCVIVGIDIGAGLFIVKGIGVFGSVVQPLKSVTVRTYHPGHKVVELIAFPLISVIAVV